MATPVAVLAVLVVGIMGEREHRPGRSSERTDPPIRSIPDAGHFIPDEKPADLWKAIHEFIVKQAAD
jgi:pimeloyl-ACP methyl ester carboxylesterase